MRSGIRCSTGYHVLSGVCVTIAGCAEFTARPVSDRPLPPVSDRIQQAYEDAASGRFITLADFETVEHAQIFRIEGTTSFDNPRITAQRSRQETGAGSLSAVFNTSSDVLLCDSETANDWSLVRDWSGYHLFLATVHAPRDGIVLRLDVRSGTDHVSMFERAGLPLSVGWNLLRFDLADIGERVDLTDVRSVRFSCSNLSEPVELFFDDLVLADNRRDLFGSPDAAPGSLYVRTEGRRLRVGSVGRFEIVFARGRIVQWFDASRDSERLVNLVGLGSLGPLPLLVRSAESPLAVDPDDENQWRPLGELALARQAVLEAGRVRVVVRGERFYLTPGQEPGEDTPNHTATYTVYPQGRIVTQLQCTTASADWRAENVGLLFTTDGRQEFRAIRHPPAASDAVDEISGVSYLIHGRDKPDRTDLVYVMHDAQQGPLLRSVDASGDPRLCTLVMGAEPEYPVATFCGLTVLWPADLHQVANVEPVAIDYCRPARIQPAVGQAVETDPGDANNDGFDEATGCYVLQLDDNVGRFTLDGSKRLRFYPCFKLAGTADRQIWVYLNGKQLESQARDADGNVIFQIPRIVNRSALVEIHAGPRGAGQPSLSAP